MFNLYRIFSVASQVGSLVIGTSSENAIATYKEEYQQTPKGNRIIMPEDIVAEEVEIGDVDYENETVVVRLANIISEPKEASLIINN